jgi:hypothetical protein
MILTLPSGVLDIDAWRVGAAGAPVVANTADGRIVDDGFFRSIRQDAARHCADLHALQENQG